MDIGQLKLLSSHFEPNGNYL